MSQGEAISAQDSDRLRKLIYEQSGIVLNADKNTMLELRIKPRLCTLHLQTFAEYCDYLFSSEGQKDEIVHLLDVVSINKTHFFPEPDHFEFLTRKALPDLMARNDGHQLMVWSAGCSTGEEPYTLAKVLNEYAQDSPGVRFRVLATDLSHAALEKADKGVFTGDVVGPVPVELRRRYFLRSHDPQPGLLRVVPELRELVDFARLNFMDADFGISQKADVIFCRNVIIYFDRLTQERILQKLASCLLPGGYLFVGHSESLHGMNLPLMPVAPAL